MELKMQEIDSKNCQKGDVSGERPVVGVTCLLPGGTIGHWLVAKNGRKVTLAICQLRKMAITDFTQ